MSVELSMRLDRDDVVPYFLWDEPMTLAEFRDRLSSAAEPERDRLLGKVLREARDTDVWPFTTPRYVVNRWERLSRHLGRRRAFWEYLLNRWREDGWLRGDVDLVLDRSSQGGSVVVRDGIPLDAPEEILANKLCTLLSRAEIRDAVDVIALERAGYALDAALTRAAEKDAGLTPAQLAWVVSEIALGDAAAIPGPYSVDELRSYLRSL